MMASATRYAENSFEKREICCLKVEKIEIVQELFSFSPKKFSPKLIFKFKSPKIRYFQNCTEPYKSFFNPSIVFKKIGDR
jgi:hypothetical protein